MIPLEIYILFCLLALIVLASVVFCVGVVTCR